MIQRLSLGRGRPGPNQLEPCPHRSTGPRAQRRSERCPGDDQRAERGRGGRVSRRHAADALEIEFNDIRAVAL